MTDAQGADAPFPAATGPFLVRDGDRESLLAACVRNHLAWLARISDASGGRTRRVGALDWATTPYGGHVDATAALCGPPGDAPEADLRSVISLGREHGARSLGLWAARDTDAPRMAGLLAAHGGTWGVRPLWMVLDTRTVARPPGLDATLRAARMTLPDRLDTHVEPELLCFHPDLSPIRQEMMRTRPQRVWHVVEWDEDGPVGQISLNVTVGADGVLGLHDGAAVQRARVRGPRLNRFDVFVRFARDVGARYIVLNATSRSAPLYRAAGFTLLGHGQTWWVGQSGLSAPPSVRTLALADSVSRNLPLPEDLEPGDLDAPLPNGMRPLELAGRVGADRSAGRLLDAGATPDLISLWDLGRHTTIDALLARDPGAVCARYPGHDRSLLHAAVERDDPELVSWLVEAGADLDARDDHYGTTPLTWALSLRLPAVARILYAAERRREGPPA